MEITCTKTATAADEKNSGEKVFEKGKQYETGVILDQGGFWLSVADSSGKFHKVAKLVIDPSSSEFFHEHFNEKSITE
jgi:hypothetical protein